MVGILATTPQYTKCCVNGITLIVKVFDTLSSSLTAFRRLKLSTLLHFEN